MTPTAATTMTPLALRRHHPAPDWALPDVRMRDYSFRNDLLLALLPAGEHGEHIARGLVEHRAKWEGWGTAVLALRRGPEPLADFPFRQAHDAGTVARLYGADHDAGDAILAVLDHRGRFMDGWRVPIGTEPDWHEVAETVRWVAVQEPECGACALAEGWDTE